MTFISIKQTLINLFRKKLVINSLWMLLYQVLRIFLQGGYFVIIARLLGTEQYGIFASILALAGILSPFANMGWGLLLIKNVSRVKESFNNYWGNTLFMILVCSSGLILLILLFKSLIFPDTISLMLVLVVALTEFLFTKIIDTTGKAYQAVQELSKTSLINIMLFAFRFLTAVLVMLFFVNLKATEWVFYYFISTGITAFLAVIFIQKDFGYPIINLSKIKSELSEGFYFSLSVSSQRVNSNIDKIMLTHFSSLGATGIYAAAYRLIDTTLAPVRSITYAAYARFFKDGETGISGNIYLAKRLSFITGLYGIVAGIGLFIAAPYFPEILGEEYREISEVLRWLAPLPFFKAMQFLSSDALSGAGFQKIRSILIVVTACLNVGLNIWLIPLFSWKGAAWSSLLCESFLMFGLWVTVFYHFRQESNKDQLTKNAMKFN